MNLTNFSLINTLSVFLINLIICTVSRKYLTYKGLTLIFLLFNLILLILNCYLWRFFVLNNSLEVLNIKLNSNNWTNINYEIAIKINSLNFLFVFLVNIIGFCTNIYILNYFKHEERSEEFILLINWFIFSMIFLVISNNFFSLILGWELIGLTSFLLINFWKFKSTTLACSFKAFTFNKISDIFLMIGCAILWNNYKINNIDTLLTIITLNHSNNNSLFFAGFCLMLSSCIKSAQIIGHLWLPDSMEAPVPASALIHSATLVSAGIYILLKFNVIFNLTGLTTWIFAIGSVTACYGGLAAAAQSDMKKLLAYSTISHCGFIFASVSLNNFIITIIYLYLHGLFKAMTFFTAGSIIKINNTQDMRLMGSAKNQLMHIVTLTIATINLGGLPFTFGYMYKLLFLKFLIINHVNIFFYGLLISGMLCSVVYVFKLIYYSCFDYRKGNLLVNFLLLQNEKSSSNSNNLKFNNLKYLAFLILLSYASLFFFIVKTYILKNFFLISTNNKTIINDYMFLNKYFATKSILISSFYKLFSLLIVAIMNFHTRQSSSVKELNELMLTLTCFTILLVIISRILSNAPNTESMTCFNYVCKAVLDILKYVWNN